MTLCRKRRIRLSMSTQRSRPAVVSSVNTGGATTPSGREELVSLPVDYRKKVSDYFFVGVAPTSCRKGRIRLPLSTQRSRPTIVSSVNTGGATT